MLWATPHTPFFIHLISAISFFSHSFYIHLFSPLASINREKRNTTVLFLFIAITFSSPYVYSSPLTHHGYLTNGDKHLTSHKKILLLQPKIICGYHFYTVLFIFFPPFQTYNSLPRLIMCCT
ncbi:hypothetical protein V8G54_031009 [Vigna mungo]|uniref:Uncharacterized protein n=1 Tax=Vigna mungo TaxID=3915 RepID=A0AAQ3MXH1_VIGMU